MTKRTKEVLGSLLAILIALGTIGLVIFAMRNTATHKITGEALLESGALSALPGTFDGKTFNSLHSSYMPLGEGVAPLPEDYSLADVFYQISFKNKSADPAKVWTFSTNKLAWGIQNSDPQFLKTGTLVMTFYYYTAEAKYSVSGSRNGATYTGYRQTALTFFYNLDTGELWQGKTFVGAALKDKVTVKGLGANVYNDVKSATVDAYINSLTKAKEK